VSTPQREITLRFLAQPGDVNFGGKVHGGAVMKWIDQGGYACAAGWSGRYCVTVYVGGIQFERPIGIGQVVEVRAQVVLTGRTSMHVAVDVAARDPRNAAVQRTTHCLMVFVAVDEAGKPVEVPAHVPATDEQRALADYARRIAALRGSIEEERRAFLDRYPASSGAA
jgi:acyl-CoA hydrolase